MLALSTIRAIVLTVEPEPGGEQPESATEWRRSTPNKNKGLLKPGWATRNARSRAMSQEQFYTAVIQLSEANMTVDQIVMLTGRDERAVQRARARFKAEGIWAVINKGAKKPIPYDNLLSEHKHLIRDSPEGFRDFCNYFWPSQQMPRHVFRIVKACFDHQDRKWRSNLILNVGPGFAKSIYFSRRWVIWRLCQNRDWRIAIVSETAQLANDWVQEIADELVSNIPLINAFGQFFNEQPNTWRTGHGMFKVLGASIKVRWNVIGRGRGQQLQGMRLDEIVVDDPETPDTIMSLEDRERTVKWLDYVLENRLEPETGVLRLIATRFDLRDIPGILIDRTYEDGTPMWQHVSFPALFDPATGSASVESDAESLWPERFPVHVLRNKREKLTPVLFDPLYQQEPRPEGAATYDMAWIEGSEHHKGCLDKDRSAGIGAEFFKDDDPRKWAGEKIRVFSLDPSGVAGYWALVVADVCNHRDSSDFKAVIIDIRRGKWTTQQFLDEVGSVCEAFHPRFFIPERNMRADLWNGQNTDFNRLKAMYGFQNQPFFTGANKRDMMWGIESLALDFMDGRIRIPYGDDRTRREIVKPLLTEIYEHPHGRTDDVLMALWVMKMGWRDLYTAAGPSTVVNGGWEIPDFARMGWG
jgi:hypothetical protein